MTDPAPLADADLIAYLDGELDDDAARAVEGKLATDPLARKKADAFRRSFALLDALPRPEPQPDFTARTVTRLQPVGASTVVRPVTTGRRWGGLVAATVVLVAGLAGAAVRMATRASNSPATPLMADLPVIESLPLYVGADDLAFVRRLDAVGLFPADITPVRFDPADPSPETREKLSTAFQKMPATRQQQVRDLHSDLMALPTVERDRLGRVLERYAGWLDRLPATERSRVLAAPAAEARLIAIGDAVLTSRREALPIRKREQLASLRTDERLQLLADLRATEQATDADWHRAAEHWRKLAATGVRPWPFDTPDGAKQVDEFVRSVLRADFTGKPDESCRLSVPELTDLRTRHDAATRDGHWFLYGLGVWRLAERHPSLPKPRTKPPVARPTDLTDLKLRPQLVSQLEKLPSVGRWPEFARAAERMVGGKKVLPVPTDGFGPCRPGEFPDAIEAVLAELLPTLTTDERRRLDKAKGNWPEYPDLFLRLAKDRDKSVPGVTLPGPPSKWAATYGGTDVRPR